MNITNFYSKLPKSLIVQNRLIKNYYIFKQFETGICLYGWEIKSLKQKRVEISKSYVTVFKEEVFIKNLYIQPLRQHFNFNILNKKTYKYINRSKKLLLHKKEISYLSNNIKKKGYTIILICLYWKYRWCKALISLAKGKKIFEKKRDIKNKEWDRTKGRLNKQNII